MVKSARILCSAIITLFALGAAVVTVVIVMVGITTVTHQPIRFSHSADSGPYTLTSGLSVGDAKSIGCQPTRRVGSGTQFKTSSIFSRNHWLVGEIAIVAPHHLIMGVAAATAGQADKVNQADKGLRTRLYVLVEWRGQLVGLLATSRALKSRVAQAEGG